VKMMWGHELPISHQKKRRSSDFWGEYRIGAKRSIHTEKPPFRKQVSEWTSERR
jgi:hypothetical protein